MEYFAHSAIATEDEALSCPTSAMPSGNKSSFEFGAFFLNARTRLLLREGQLIPVAPKTMDMLLLLVQRRGEVVEKDELIAKLWPDVSVDENSLSQQVFILRKILGSENDGHYIETVPRRGYRFSATVTEIPEKRAFEEKRDASQVPASSPEETALAQPAERTRNRWRYVALAALLIALGGMLAYRSVSQKPHSANASQPIRSIVVLPLANLSQDASQDYVAEGLSEELISDLARLGSLRVISRTSAMQYRGTRKTIRQIGRELNVDAVIEGAFISSNGHIRVTAQMIDARTDAHIWGETYERDAQDLLPLEAGLAQDIAEQVRVQLTAEQTASLRHRAAIDAVAYEAYLKGRFFWNKRTESDYLEAIKYFEQALSRDPKYAQAYAGLADAYALLGSVSAMSISRGEAMEKARVAATRALELDSSLAEAHTSLAFVLMHYDWNLREAEKEYRAAIRLNPSYATAHQWYATSLAASGRMQESLSEIAAAQEIDPLSLVINTDRGELLTYARRYDDAIRQFQSTLRLEPNFLLAHLMLTNCYLDSGDTAQGLREAQKALELNGKNLWVRYNLARAYARSGDRAKAQRLLAALDRNGPERNSAILASVATFLGDQDAAFRYLDGGYRERQGTLILINVDPEWDQLRSDPRFARFVQRMALNQSSQN